MADLTHVNQVASTLLLEQAGYLSSGYVSSAMSAKLGYIYRESRPLYVFMPGNDPAIINSQTGQFKASWKYDPVRGRFFNTAPYVNVLFSGIQNKTISRPTIDRLVTPKIEREVTKASANDVKEIIADMFKGL